MWADLQVACVDGSLSGWWEKCSGWWRVPARQAQGSPSEHESLSVEPKRELQSV